MADQKISELTNITGANLADADEFVVVDVSADQTKAVTRAEFFKDTPSITVGGTTELNGNTTVNGGNFTVQGSTGSVWLTDTDVSATSRIWQTGENLYIDNQSAIGGKTHFRTDNGKIRQIIRDNGDISFRNTAGTVESFYWDAADERLGLGTTNPSAALDVVGNAEINGNVTVAGTGAAANLYWQSASVDHTNAFARNSDGNFGFYDVENGRTWFRHVKNASVSSQELNLLEGGGYVSIGNTTPAAALDVSGDVILRQDGTTTTSERRLAVRSLGYAVLELSGDRGNTTGEPGGAGMTVGVDGTGPNGVVSYINTTGEDGVGGSYTGASDNSMLVGTISNHPLTFGYGSTVKLAVTATQFRPVADNNLTLGGPSFRWSTVYAASGSINTSDATTKQDIEVISEAETRVALACKGLMRKFRFIDAVEKKGDDARIHFGIIAQDLQAAFVAEGLDPNQYAMFCSDTWWEEDIVIPARDAVDAVLDDEGNVVKEGREAVPETTQRKVYETAEEATETATEVTRLGVRYSELLAFIIAAI